MPLLGGHLNKDLCSPNGVEFMKILYDRFGLTININLTIQVRMHEFSMRRGKIYFAFLGLF